MVIKMSLLSFRRIVLSVLFTLVLSAKIVTAADFYVDPVNGSMSNDGSKEHPWSTLQEVFDSCKIQTQAFVTPYNSASPTTTTKCPSGVVHGGDTINLLSGYQGSLSIIGAVNTDWITVKAAPGATPTFKNILMQSASKWIFDGLSISTSYAPPIAKVTALFRAENHSYTGPSSYITIKNCNIFSSESIVGWLAQDWDTKASLGISASASYMDIDNNDLRNVAGGIAITASHHSTITNNTIENSSQDGVRFIGSDYVKFEYNVVKNIYVVYDYSVYHYDLMQSWTTDGDVEGVEIRGNLLIAHEDTNQPYKGGTSVQGIGFFDGWFNNFTIENNLVLIDGTHGISVWGANNTKVVNNTVASNLGGGGAPIIVVPHKNHALGSGNTIRNNFANDMVITWSGYTSGTTVDHNIEGFVNSDHFSNPAILDFSLKSTSTAINAGATNLAPTIDFRKKPREMAPDIGAYEFGEAPADLPSVNIKGVKLN